MDQQPDEVFRKSRGAARSSSRFSANGKYQDIRGDGCSLDAVSIGGVTDRGVCLVYGGTRGASSKDRRHAAPPVRHELLVDPIAGRNESVRPAWATTPGSDLITSQNRSILRHAETGQKVVFQPSPTTAGVRWPSTDDFDHVRRKVKSNEEPH